MTLVPKTGTATRVSITRERIAADLRTMGVQAGQTLLVHTSLRNIGWVDGGAQTVVQALLDALGPDGTLVAGAGTPENSITSRAFRSNVAGFSKAQYDEFRSRMPAFDRKTTPTSVGAVAEAVRTTPGAVRSSHPQSSFSAVGPGARELMADHQFNCHLGPESPLGKLYDSDASTLLIGVGYESCTAFHLAEYRYTTHPPLCYYKCVVMNKRNKRCWRRYLDVRLDDSDFDVIGKSLEDQTTISILNVGAAASRLIPIRHAVNFATTWMGEHRR